MLGCNFRRRGRYISRSSPRELATLRADTSQFHDVNWADANANFVTGDITPVGLANTDSYATTYAKASSVLKGFKALGANTVRMGFNYATVTGSWWNGYTAAIDAASDQGVNVVLAPWLQGGTIGDANAFYAMWDIVINKYASNSHIYFDIMNEPAGYSATDEDNVAAAWVARPLLDPPARTAHRPGLLRRLEPVHRRGRFAAERQRHAAVHPRLHPRRAIPPQ